MKLEELLGYVLDTLYAGLTGGSAELPLPQNTILNWVQPGLPFDESAFDFAIAGPFAGPSALTLDYFKKLVETLMGDQNGDGGLSRADAINQAKVMYQQNLLGSWEQWSRLVDFIPIVNPTESQTQWQLKPGEGKQQHVGIVYAQAGQTVSNVYDDTLQRCWVANEELTDQQKKIIERAKALLQEEVEVEDLLTGDKKTEIRESRVMTAYKQKKIDYENAVIDYATRLARANNGTAADLVEWSKAAASISGEPPRLSVIGSPMGTKTTLKRLRPPSTTLLGVAWWPGCQDSHRTSRWYAITFRVPLAIHSSQLRSCQVASRAVLDGRASQNMNCTRSIVPRRHRGIGARLEASISGS